MSIAEPTANKATLQADRSGTDTLRLSFAGDWVLEERVPDVEAVLAELDPDVRRLLLDGAGVTRWDSRLVAVLLGLVNAAQRRELTVERDALPDGARRLLDLATAVPEREGARRSRTSEPFLARVGGSAIAFWESCTEMLEFIGGAVLSLWNVLRGRGSFPVREFVTIVKRTGADALPIVSLVSALVGLILAFVGAIQLRMFGAQIYVATLVGIAMVRVMGAVMAGVIMAGRTGAAFAAEIGTMQVNEEIDALETTGISPMEYLVLPRMLALCIMMPILGVYADLMGIVGGLIVGVGMLGLGSVEYMVRTQESVGLANLWVGLVHSFVFGILVSLAGCLQGIKCGRSASSVGQAATKAVVTGIVAIVIATAILTAMFDVIGV